MGAWEWGWGWHLSLSIDIETNSQGFCKINGVLGIVLDFMLWWLGSMYSSINLAMLFTERASLTYTRAYSSPRHDVKS